MVKLNRQCPTEEEDFHSGPKGQERGSNTCSRGGGDLLTRRQPLRRPSLGSPSNISVKVSGAQKSGGLPQKILRHRDVFRRRYDPSDSLDPIPVGLYKS